MKNEPNRRAKKNLRNAPRSQKTAPSISIITVCLQAEKSIEKTIQSVIASGDVRLEYIVIDGGSTDGTVVILEKHDHAIDFWTSVPDQGIFHAMNKGVALAKGRWLLFLNAGDTLRPRMLAKLLAFADQAPPATGVVSGRINLENSRGESHGVIFPKFTGNTKLLLEDNCVCHQATLIRRAVFARHGGYSMGYETTGDYEYWLRLLRIGVGFLFSDLIVTNYSTDGISSRPENYLQVQKERNLIRIKYGYLSFYAAAAKFFRTESTYTIKKFIKKLLGKSHHRSV